MNGVLSLAVVGTLAALASPARAEAPEAARVSQPEPERATADRALSHFGTTLTGFVVDGREGRAADSQAYAGVTLEESVLRSFSSNALGHGEFSLRSGLGSGGALIWGDFEFGGGYGPPVLPGQGPFAELAVRAESFQTVPVGWTLFELPRLDVGYRVDSSLLALRASGYSGLLLGAGSPDGATHGSTAALDVGGRAIVYLDTGATMTILKLAVRDLPSAGTNPGVPVEQIDGSACLRFAGDYEACARAALMRGVRGQEGSDVQWRVWTFELGLATDMRRSSWPSADATAARRIH